MAETPLHPKLRRGIARIIKNLLKVAHERGYQLDDIEKIVFAPAHDPAAGSTMRDINIVFNRTVYRHGGLVVAGREEYLNEYLGEVGVAT